MTTVRSSRRVVAGAACRLSQVQAACSLTLESMLTWQEDTICLRCQMDTDLRATLRWFHALEINQVALYRAQAALAEKEVDRRMFLKAARCSGPTI